MIVGWEETLASNSKERDAAEKEFRKTQKLQDGEKAMSGYIAETHAVRAKTARLRELRLAKEAGDKKAQKPRTKT
jgi:hypothetical protein